MAASMPAMFFLILRPELDEGRDPTALRPDQPLVEHGEGEHPLGPDGYPELLLHQVGPVELGVDLGDPGQLAWPDGGSGPRGCATGRSDNPSALWRAGSCRPSAPRSTPRGGPRRGPRWPTARHEKCRCRAWRSCSARPPRRRSTRPRRRRPGGSAHSARHRADRRTRSSVFLSRPTAAQTRRPVSWSTQMVR